MSPKSALTTGILTFALSSTAQAAATDDSFRQPEKPAAAPAATPDKVTNPGADADNASNRGWTLSLEGVATAPIDAGIQAGLETPFGLRLSAGYGWIPSASLGWLRSTSIASGSASATVNVTDASGHIFRLKVGIRPFSKLGLYLDAGYARAELTADVDVTGSVAELGSVSGAYRGASSVDLWLAELGYEWKIENRLVIGTGLGFMGTLHARTNITPVGTAPDSQLLGVAETATNGALEAYGFVPTLSLRVGVNVL
jgi:hypothetical protein